MKRLTFGCMIVMILSLCACKVSPMSQVSTMETGSDTVSCMKLEEKYLIADTETDLISVHLPANESLTEENMRYIQSDIVSQIVTYTGEEFDLILSSSDVADKEREYTAHYLMLTSEVSYCTDDLVSITYKGMHNAKWAAHPTNVFFVQNFNPKTNKSVTFPQLYSIESNIYENFAEQGYAQLLERFNGAWPDGLGDFAEAVCSEDTFFAGLKNGLIPFYFTTEGIGFVMIDLPRALGAPLNVVVPYPGQGDGSPVS